MSSFWDDIGSRIGEAGQVITDAGKRAAMKTQSIADLTRLNRQVEDAKRESDEACRELGRSYYEEHKDDPDAPEKALFIKIRRADEKVHDLKTEIAVIRGVEECPVCGYLNSVDANFCNRCGAPLSGEGKRAADHDDKKDAAAAEEERKDTPISRDVTVDAGVKNREYTILHAAEKRDLEKTQELEEAAAESDEVAETVEEAEKSGSPE